MAYMKPYKFVNWEVPELSELADAPMYRLREKINNNERLTREEKNYITSHINKMYSATGIPFRGWLFPFKDVLKKYWYKQNGNLYEAYAIDKTALRVKERYGGKIEKIIEIH